MSCSGRSLEWTLAKSLDDMDKAGVATAITSVTTPGRIFAGSEGRRVARECNEYAAKLVADHRGRFGMFAALPLTDTEGSLREIEYSLDTLHADGISLFTSYGDKWLGDPSFEPVMAELGRRKAVVYTHPDAPNCCRDPLLPDFRESVIEYGTDTTRAIARLLSTGTAMRYRDIKLDILTWRRHGAVPGRAPHPRAGHQEGRRGGGQPWRDGGTAAVLL